MNIETLHQYCITKPGVTEGFPFDTDTLVFKVGGKMFLLISLAAGNRFNVKCEPELAVELRDRYTEVQPGFHMSKTHWNTVHMDGALTDKQLRDMIDHSYQLILKSLTKKLQAKIGNTQ